LPPGQKPGGFFVSKKFTGLKCILPGKTDHLLRNQAAYTVALPEPSRACTFGLPQRQADPLIFRGKGSLLSKEIPSHKNYYL
jgi:hypothetical protein